jgi:hypothetical protein
MAKGRIMNRIACATLIVGILVLISAFNLATA